MGFVKICFYGTPECGCDERRRASRRQRGGGAREVGVFMYNGEVGTIRDGGRVVKREIPKFEKTHTDLSVV